MSDNEVSGCYLLVRCFVLPMLLIPVIAGGICFSGLWVYFNFIQNKGIPTLPLLFGVSGAWFVVGVIVCFKRFLHFFLKSRKSGTKIIDELKVATSGAVTLKKMTKRGA
jgi:uncharacterized membrane protein YciS (DUF1049 family)